MQRIREREGASKAVFAHYLNVATRLVGDWERGAKDQSGASLKLLAVVKAKGLGAIARNPAGLDRGCGRFYRNPCVAVVRCSLSPASLHDYGYRQLLEDQERLLREFEHLDHSICDAECGADRMGCTG